MKPLLARIAAGLALAGSAATAHAGTVTLTVTNAEGRPAADAVVLVQPTATWAPQPLPATAVIRQQDIRFVPYVTVVPVGGAVRFVNADRFDHHIRSQPGGPLGSVPPAKQFEYRLGPPGRGNDSSPEIRLDIPGTILVGCHLHGSMRGHVFVAGTPWFAVSDEKGRVRIEGVPDGQAEVRLWHPDQLVDQASLRVQVAGTVVTGAQLNFTPRSRPPPRPPSTRPKGEYED